jgi:hypothetical protein
MWRKSSRDQSLAALLAGEPIVPRHNIPATLTGDWSPGMASDTDHRFFSDFDLFGERVNRFYTPDKSWEGGPWRLQELAETLVTRYDDPTFGRRYVAFFNQARVGIVEISAYLDYHRETEPIVTTLIQLEHAHLLPYSDVVVFLTFLAQNTACADENEYAKSVQAIDRALIASLWESIRNDSDGEIELFLQGSAMHYLKWRSLVLGSRST